jgi:glycosyltransferase involved in cell wall biosynthesis
MLVSVVIPVYNERRTIEQLVAQVLAIDLEKQIVIVDDCSCDGTRDAIDRLVQKHGQDRITAIFQEKNLGKGAALRRGFEVATGQIIIVQDADLEYNPQEYPKLIAPILRGEADVVYGSRFVGGQAHRVLYFWHAIGNRLVTLLSNMFTDLNLTDMETCYKAFRRQIIEQVQLKENRFGFEPEFTAKVAKLRCRIYEVGISYNGRTYDEGKKIGWRDAILAIWCIVRYNVFTSRSRAAISTAHPRTAQERHDAAGDKQPSGGG